MRALSKYIVTFMISFEKFAMDQCTENSNLSFLMRKQNLARVERLSCNTALLARGPSEWQGKCCAPFDVYVYTLKTKQKQSRLY